MTSKSVPLTSTTSLTCKMRLACGKRATHMKEVGNVSFPVCKTHSK
jgi:hypothetical protein